MNRNDNPLVFIDTCIFKKHKFSITTNQLYSVWKQIRYGEIFLLMPEITKLEIISNFEKELKENYESLNKYKNQISKLLENVPDSKFTNIINNIDIDYENKTFLRTFNKFTASKNVINLKTSLADSSTVFKQYFLGEAPFNNSKKKSEFPDAFVLDILSRYATQYRKRIIVVSVDRDFKDYCINNKNLYLVDSIKKMKEAIRLKAHKFDAKIVEKVKYIMNIKENKEIFISKITNLFKNHSFEYCSYDSYDTFSDEFLDDITCKDVNSINLLDFEILNIMGDYVENTIEIEYDITLTILVNDYENSPWDSELKEYIYLEKCKVERVVTGYMNLNLEFNLNGSNFIIYPDDYSLDFYL